MLSELLGKKKTPAARQHNLAIAEQVLDIRRLKAAREELADEIWTVMMSVQNITQRLDDLPAAIETCDRERFRALTRWELHADQYGNRETEFADYRAGLLAEQQTLAGKRTALEAQKGQLDKQVGELKYAISRAEQAVWDAISKHLADELGAQFRERVMTLWAAAWQGKDGISPVASLDLCLDFRSFDDASRVASLEKLRAESDVP